MEIDVHIRFLRAGWETGAVRTRLDSSNNGVIWYGFWIWMRLTWDFLVMVDKGELIDINIAKVSLKCVSQMYVIRVSFFLKDYLV